MLHINDLNYIDILIVVSFLWIYLIYPLTNIIQAINKNNVMWQVVIVNIWVHPQ
jgi:hypothetical protein